MFHWFRAIGQEQRSEILRFSNMDGDGKAPVGAFKGLSAYGAYDMAGNVKEWAWNATGDMRYVLGGSWNEPTNLFRHLIAQDPWGREPVNGVRCAHYATPPAEQLTAPVTPLREYPRPAPIAAAAFELLRGLYAYDRDALEARVERADESPPHYRRETVSFRTAYGDERSLHPAMDPVHFAPRSATPTLMINGRDDFMVPYDVAQRPLFEMLGAPDSAKRHARLTGGHIPSDTREIMREVLDWLDRWFGPVRRGSVVARGGS